MISYSHVINNELISICFFTFSFSINNLISTIKNKPLKRPSKFSLRALISLRIFSCPWGDVLAIATSPVCWRCSTRSSPWACLFSRASRGATTFSMASLSLRGLCFHHRLLCRDDDPYTDFHASVEDAEMIIQIHDINSHIIPTAFNTIMIYILYFIL